MTDPFASVRTHIQEAGSRLAAALQECDRLAGAGPSDRWAAGQRVAIHDALVEAGRRLSKAEVLSYPNRRTVSLLPVSEAPQIDGERRSAPPRGRNTPGSGQ